MRIRTAAVTHRGVVRPHNEDTIAVAGWLCSVDDGVPLELVVDSSDGVLLAVADGLGGHPEGERASMLALRTLIARREALSTPEGLVAAVHDADRALYAEMDEVPAARGMGSTLAGFAVLGDVVRVVNVGDSRCYATSGGSLVQVSVDDSSSVDGAPTHIVDQTLGGWSAPDALDPHVGELAVEPGARLLVCSDGLSDVLDPDRIASAVLSADGLAEVVATLLRWTLEAGAPDNVSVVLAELPADRPS
ncbi:MAG TPA: protein phosphatase 2C domain-containing protein [Modestobacter sp.]|jgi:serine/threonine protein phosphatase PrpC|nr:protein phosphatase 2C domain-containing protein [Modestobacter sp.]